jgi:hypothetical protein
VRGEREKRQRKIVIITFTPVDVPYVPLAHAYTHKYIYIILLQRHADTCAHAYTATHI